MGLKETVDNNATTAKKAAAFDKIQNTISTKKSIQAGREIEIKKQAEKDAYLAAKQAEQAMRNSFEFGQIAPQSPGELEARAMAMGYPSDAIQETADDYNAVDNSQEMLGNGVTPAEDRARAILNKLDEMDGNVSPEEMNATIQQIKRPVEEGGEPEEVRMEMNRLQELNSMPQAAATPAQAISTQAVAMKSPATQASQEILAAMAQPAQQAPGAEQAIAQNQGLEEQAMMNFRNQGRGGRQV